MAGKVITSVSLPAEVLKEAERIAKEKHKSRSEVIKEAVLMYVEDHQWRAMQEELAPYAAAKGIRTEEDVEKLVRGIRKSSLKKS